MGGGPVIACIDTHAGHFATCVDPALPAAFVMGGALYGSGQRDFQQWPWKECACWCMNMHVPLFQAWFDVLSLFWGSRRPIVTLLYATWHFRVAQLYDAVKLGASLFSCEDCLQGFLGFVDPVFRLLVSGVCGTCFQGFVGPGAVVSTPLRLLFLLEAALLLRMLLLCEKHCRHRQDAHLQVVLSLPLVCAHITWFGLV